MGRHQSRAPTQALFRTQAARAWAAASAAVSQGTLPVLRRVSRMHRRSKSTTSATAAKRGDGGCARLALAGHGIAPCASCWWPRVSRAAPGGGVAPSSGQTSAQSSWPSSHLVRKLLGLGSGLGCRQERTPSSALAPPAEFVSLVTGSTRATFASRPDLRLKALPKADSNPGGADGAVERQLRGAQVVHDACVRREGRAGRSVKPEVHRGAPARPKLARRGGKCRIRAPPEPSPVRFKKDGGSYRIRRFYTP